ncbi:MAG: hypothetical protein ACKV2V_05880 [Blastocatellia bacterium]
MRKTRSMAMFAPLVLSCFVILALGQKPGPASRTPPAAPKKAAEKPATPVEGKKSEPAAEGKKELSWGQQRGLALLDQAGNEAAELRDKRVIARLQGNAGAAMWKYRPERGRELFRSAFDNALKHYRETEDDNQTKAGRDSFVRRADERLEILQTIRRHDAELGAELTGKYIAEKQRELEERRYKNAASRQPVEQLWGREESGGADLINVASSILGVDQSAAVGLAGRAVNAGILPGTIQFLYNLSEKNRQQADTLFMQALTRMAAEPLPHPGQLLLLSAYAFGADRVLSGHSQSLSISSLTVPAKYQSTPAITQAFAGAALEVIARNAAITPGQIEDAPKRLEMAFLALRYLTPQLETHAPARAPEIQELTARMAQLISQQARESINEINADQSRRPLPGKPDDQAPDAAAAEKEKAKLDRASQTSDLRQRDELYAEVAMSAARAGDYTRALELTDKISNLEDQLKLRSWISFQAAEKLAGKGEIEQARKHAQHVREADQRAWLLIKMAQAALKTDDRARANELLDEALKHATDAEYNPARIRALTGITNTLTGFNPNHAFETAAEITRSLNRLKDPLDDRGLLTRLLEIGGSSMVATTTADNLSVGPTMALLAARDFDQTLTLCQTIDNKQTRLAILIDVAAVALAPEKQEKQEKKVAAADKDK